MINVKTWLADIDNIAKGIIQPNRREKLEAQCTALIGLINNSAEMNEHQANYLEITLIHMADVPQGTLDVFIYWKLAGVVNGFHA